VGYLTLGMQWLLDISSSSILPVILKHMTMKKIMLIILTCVVASCSATKGIINIDDNMKKISVGMTKKKVISVLGHHYEVISSKERTITLGYKAPNNGIYRLVFVDNKLKEWSKDHLRNNRDNRYFKRNSPQ